MARTPEQNREYQRQYRLRKRAETAGQLVDRPVVLKTVTKPRGAVRGVDAPLFPNGDRDRGLPRSNYYSNPSEPGGWTETIQRIDPHLAQRILDRVAPPRKMR